MDFAFTTEHEQVRKAAKEFAAREILPNIKENDRNQTFDTSLLPKMAEAGLLGISVPVRYGGAGFDYISLGIVAEELEYADTSARVIISVHNGLNSLGILQWGTEEQKQMFLTPQALGEKYAAFCLTEPDAAPMWWPCVPPPAKMATITSSPARRCGSAWPMWPTISCGSPRPTRTRNPRIAASPPLWSPAT